MCSAVVLSIVAGMRFLALEYLRGKIAEPWRLGINIGKRATYIHRGNTDPRCERPVEYPFTGPA